MAPTEPDSASLGRHIIVNRSGCKGTSEGRCATRVARASLKCRVFFPQFLNITLQPAYSTVANEHQKPRPRSMYEVTTLRKPGHRRPLARHPRRDWQLRPPLPPSAHHRCRVPVPPSASSPLALAASSPPAAASRTRRASAAGATSRSVLEDLLKVGTCRLEDADAVRRAVEILQR